MGSLRGICRVNTKKRAAKRPGADERMRVKFNFVEE